MQQASCTIENHNVGRVLTGAEHLQSCDMDVADPSGNLQRALVELARARTPSEGELSTTDRLKLFSEIVKYGGMPTMAPLLPLVLSLDGKPYSVIDKHYQFETLFYTRMPKQMVLKTGRQVGKSTVGAAHGIITCTSIPYFRTLYITPLFEQVRRLSNNYVGPFIEQSPVKQLWTGSGVERSVLQRSFKNYSMMQFSFAMLNADRVRGVRADRLIFDEVQDMNRDNIPIIKETMSASEWALVQYAGTPKTPDNTIQGLWNASSKAEWAIPCRACKKWNIASSDQDLHDMIGPWREDISENEPATICANKSCRRIINPKHGRWLHREPSKRFEFAGLHIPQPIMHIHYSKPAKWAELLAKREGIGNYTPAKFMNEVLGESCGIGMQLVSEAELQAASDGRRPNDSRNPAKAAATRERYELRVLAVDWGGGGEEGVSLTTVAVLGMRSNGRIEVIWARRLMTPHDHLLEAAECLRVFRLFKCKHLAHDYTGAGTLRETFLVQAGLSVDQIVPIQYVRAASQQIMYHVKPTVIHPRHYWRLDKTRALLTVCSAIRTGLLKFFAYDYKNTDDPGLIRDFLSLTEKKTETRLGSDIYTIGRAADQTDDFAQAVNIGCCTLWKISNRWPTVTTPIKFNITEEYAKALDPEKVDWHSMT